MIAASTIFSSKIVPSVGLAGVIGVQHMIHTCTRRFYNANFSQKFLNSAATTPSLNLWAQRCLRFCKRNKGSLLFGAFAACVTLSYVRIQKSTIHKTNSTCYQRNNGGKEGRGSLEDIYGEIQR